VISQEKHKKHADLVRPDFGDYGRNELAILGAPCGIIQKLADRMISSVEHRWNIAYIDADHAHGDEEPEPPFSGNQRFTDKIAFRQLEMRTDPNKHEIRPLLDSNDLILINGNHFIGTSQIVMIHPKKKESLSRKLDRLTDVQLVIKMSSEDTIYPFLEDHIDDDVPVYTMDQEDEIISWFEGHLETTVPPLHGLVLAGGKSQRLGHDKTVIKYHGEEHWVHLAKTLSDSCDRVYVSRRPGQNELEDDFVTLEDEFVGLGPFGGILTAFKNDPNSAWLVVASDLPFAPDAIDALLAQRNPSKVATAFHNPDTGFPDPLMTIWEPRAYPVLLSFLAQGYSCPRKALINSDIQEVEIEDPKWLLNVNTAEDLDRAISKLK